MKKRIISTIIVLLVLGTIFGLALHQNNNQITNSVIDIICPAIAYADSDTVGGKMPPPPPPPPIN
ncbi:MAG: hypothetical protein ACUVUH_10030 [bacterium]